MTPALMFSFEAMSSKTEKIEDGVGGSDCTIAYNSRIQYTGSNRVNVQHVNLIVQRLRSKLHNFVLLFSLPHSVYTVFIYLIQVKTN